MLLLSILFGLLTVLALPPLSALPMAIVGISGFGWLLNKAGSWRQAALIGWGFFFGYHLLGLYWISFSLLTNIGRYWWMLPFSITGLPAGLALFGNVIGVGTYWLGRAGGWRRWLALGLCWTIVEYGRGYLLTGFPWNLISSIWTDWLAVAQLASVTGPHGLGLLTVLTASLGMMWPKSKQRRAALITAMVCPWLAVAIWGGLRLDQKVPMVDGLLLRMIQPNLSVSEKHDVNSYEKNLGTLVRLSSQPTEKDQKTVVQKTVVLWPEAATPYLLGNATTLRQEVMAAMPPATWLVTGVPFQEKVSDNNAFLYNSLLVIAPDATIAARFDKRHLVPFGEYMPLRHILPLDAIAAGSTDFSPGSGDRLVSTPVMPPFAPLICYEVIFPGAVTDDNHRARWIVNITNDAWFGLSAGPHQHFASARMRAIEEGLPLVRVANTGISGVIDPLGHILVKSPLGQQMVVESSLPQALPGITPYAQWKEWPVWLFIGTGLLGLCWPKRRRTAQQSPQPAQTSPKAWMTERDADWLEAKILALAAQSSAEKPLRVIEWGSGRSTLYFTAMLAERGVPCQWLVLEHDRDYFDQQIKKDFLAHPGHYVHDAGRQDALPSAWTALAIVFDVRFAPYFDGTNPDHRAMPMDDYVNWPKDHGIRADLILVDGRKRRRCLETARDLITENGVIVLHDAGRPWYDAAWQGRPGWHRVGDDLAVGGSG